MKFESYKMLEIEWNIHVRTLWVRSSLAELISLSSVLSFCTWSLSVNISWDCEVHLLSFSEWSAITSFSWNNHSITITTQLYSNIEQRKRNWFHNRWDPSNIFYNIFSHIYYIKWLTNSHSNGPVILM